MLQANLVEVVKFCSLISDCVHMILAHFENGEKFKDRPPDHTKMAPFCWHISKTVNFEKGTPTGTF